MYILEGVTLGQITITNADDIALLGEDLDMIKRLGNKLINTARKVDLTVNEDKTEYLVASQRNRNDGKEQYIKIEKLNFKRVSQFKYLGLIIIKDNDVNIEVSARIQQTNKEYYGLNKY